MKKNLSAIIILSFVLVTLSASYSLAEEYELVNKWTGFGSFRSITVDK